LLVDKPDHGRAAQIAGSYRWSKHARQWIGWHVRQRHSAWLITGSRAPAWPERTCDWAESTRGARARSHAECGTTRPVRQRLKVVVRIRPRRCMD
jgi:hypothetical protein